MRQERKKTKRRNKGKGRRTVRGGKPKFIKTIAYYTDESKPMLVDYKIIHGNMDKDEQKKYADKHKVYYPVETPSIIDEIFGSVDPRKIRLMTERFFTPPLMFFEGNKVQAYRNNKLVPCEIRRNLGNDMYDVLYDNGDFELVHKDMIRPLGKQRTAIKEDGETVVIHDGEDIEKIKITNKMLMNHYVSNKLIENLEKIPTAKLVKGGAPLKQDEITKYTASVKAYNEFINKNKNTLLNGLSDAEREVAEKLLRTPVFFNIISEARGFGEIPDMNHAKIIMENNKLSGDELLKKINEHSSVPGPIISDPISEPVVIKSEESGSGELDSDASNFGKETRVSKDSLDKHIKKKLVLPHPGSATFTDMKKISGVTNTIAEKKMPPPSVITENTFAKNNIDPYSDVKRTKPKSFFSGILSKSIEASDPYDKKTVVSNSGSGGPPGPGGPSSHDKARKKEDAKEAISNIDADVNAKILDKAVDKEIDRQGGLTEESKEELKEKEDIRNKTMDLFTSSVKAYNRNNSINRNSGGRKRRKTLKRK